jgi:hypothetical protein
MPLLIMMAQLEVDKRQKPHLPADVRLNIVSALG